MNSARNLCIPVVSTLAVVVLGLCAPAFSQTPEQPAGQTLDQAPLQPSASDLGDRWGEVRILRAEGRYDEAIALLQAVFQEYANAEQVLRQAYNQLIFTQLARADTVSANTAAREALGRYPDLEADIAEYPSSLNALYAQLRAEMYGSLLVTVAKVEGAQVLLDGALRGAAPLRLPYLKTGRHTLAIMRSGYKEQTTEVEIAPGAESSLAVTLSRSGGFKRWLLPAVGTGALGAVLIFGGSPSAELPPILSEPPTPPR
jgi:tetratricopeptide (TPR) repeat protein